MKMTHRQFDGALTWLSALAVTLRITLRRMSHELVVELARLNAARVGSFELSRLAPRARVRAVKAALADHHGGISRCC